MSFLGGRVDLQHGHVQPLWTITSRIVHKPAIYCLLCFSSCQNGHNTFMRSNSISPDPSVSSSLKVSVVGGGGRSNQQQKKGFEWPYFHIAVGKKMSTFDDWTNWRGTPNERGSTQSCQSQCWGPIRCSGPLWPGAGDCWERSLSKCKKQKTINKRGNIDVEQPEGKVHVEEVSRWCAALTSVLDSHAHLWRTHTATAVHVPCFVQILMDRPHMLI